MKNLERITGANRSLTLSLIRSVGRWTISKHMNAAPMRPGIVPVVEPIMLQNPIVVQDMRCEECPENEPPKLPFESESNVECPAYSWPPSSRAPICEKGNQSSRRIN